jgi:hypothetical protein
LTQADITFNFGAKGNQYPEPARVFHEMLHAIDTEGYPGDAHRDGRLLISAELHAHAGFPDPIYACHFSCYQGGMDDREDKQMTNLRRALDKEGKEKPPVVEVPCENPTGGTINCATVSAYAGICQLGEKTPIPQSLLEEGRLEALPKCLQEQMLNGCDLGRGAAAREAKCQIPVVKKSALCRLACDWDQKQKDPKAAGAFIKMVEGSAAKIIEALPKDGEGLQDEDVFYYHELKLTGRLKKCR